MPSELFYDPLKFDLEHPAFGPSEIEALNPQRGRMRHLDAVVWLSEQLDGTIGYKDVGEDEFWVPGHIPGAPLLPGVIMIEAAAQLAAFIMRKRRPEVPFIGLIGVDQFKFRSQVVPGQRLILMGKEIEFKSRRLICAVQGVVNGTLVFEGVITGMAVSPAKG